MRLLKQKWINNSHIEQYTPPRVSSKTRCLVLIPTVNQEVRRVVAFMPGTNAEHLPIAWKYFLGSSLR